MNQTQFLEYFKKKKLSSNDDIEITVTKVITFANQNISNAELSLVEDEIEKSVKRTSKYQKRIPEKIKREVGIYADSLGTASAIKKFTSKYSKHPFNRTSGETNLKMEPVTPCLRKLGDLTLWMVT